METKLKFEISKGKKHLEAQGNYDKLISEIAFVFINNDRAYTLFKDTLDFVDRFKGSDSQGKTHTSQTMALDTLEAAIKNGSLEAVKQAHKVVTSMSWDNTHINLYKRYCDLLKKALERLLTKTV